MKHYTADYALDGVTEADFQQWKHSPVTKVVMRYLRHYERKMAEEQIDLLRTSVATPDPFGLGRFTGAINQLSECHQIDYATMISFYASEDEAKEGQA